MPTTAAARAKQQRIRFQRESLLAANVPIGTKEEPSRQRLPLMTEAEYFKAINELLVPMYAYVKEGIIPAIPGLVNQFEAETRTDDYSDEIDILFDQGDSLIQTTVTETAIRPITTETALNTSAFGKREFQKQFVSVVGVPVLQSEPWLMPLVNSFNARNVRLIQSIPADYFSELEAMIRASVEAGQSASALQADILRTVSLRATEPTAASQVGFRVVNPRHRSKLIARDQVTKFYGETNKLRQQQAGVDKYEWSTAEDERVRSSHAALDGQIFSWNKPPDVGHPGQPVQCRCVAIPVLEEFK